MSKKTNIFCLIMLFVCALFLVTGCKKTTTTSQSTRPTTTGSSDSTTTVTVKPTTTTEAEPTTTVAKEEYTVTFDSNGGTAVEAQTVIEGSKAVKPADPTKEETAEKTYTFKFWSLDGDTEYDFNVEVTGNITLTALWTEEAKTYAVSFDTDGGSNAPDAQNVAYGLKAVKPADPTKEATNEKTYTFAYWSVDGTTEYDFETEVTEAVALKAVYTVKTIITAPTLSDLAYTGSTVTANVAETEQYTVKTNEGGINVGRYDVVLEAKEGFVWDKENSTIKTIQFGITKGEIADITPATAKEGLTYTGSAQALVNAAQTQSGTVEYKLEGGNYSSEIPTAVNAGTYNVYFKVVGDSNHQDKEYEAAITVVIAKAVNTDITAPQAATLVYTGNTQALVTAGSSANGAIEYKLEGGSYSSEIPTAVNAGTYSVYYKVLGSDNYLENEVSTPVSVVIAKATTNAVSGLADLEALSCGAAIPTGFNATSVFGTVGYSYSKDGSSYVSYDEFKDTKLVDGDTLYVKASVADNANYNAAEVVKSTTVSHSYPAYVKGEGKDTSTCACGSTKEFITAVEAGVQKKVYELNNDLEATGTFSIDLTGVSEYASVESVKINGIRAGRDINAINFASLNYAYGEQIIVVTVKGADGASHEIEVPVLLVSAIFTTKAELDQFFTLAKKFNPNFGGDITCKKETDGVVSDVIKKDYRMGGYFELGANISYGLNPWPVMYDDSYGNMNDMYAGSSDWRTNDRFGFAGTFDGKGYTIDGLVIDGLYANKEWGINTNYGYAFISILNTDGVIRNISFTNACTCYGATSYVVKAGMGTVENIYVQYKDLAYTARYNGVHNAAYQGGSSSTFFSSDKYAKINYAKLGTDKPAVVRNCIIDLSKLEYASDMASKTFYIVGKGSSTSQTYENVIVIGSVGKGTEVVSALYDDWGSQVDGDKEKGITVVESYSALVGTDWSSLANSFWTVNSGCAPYCAAMGTYTAEFTQKVQEIEIGGTSTFKGSANTIISIDNVSAGVSMLNGVVTIDSAAKEGATFKVVISSVFDSNVKEEVTVTIVKAKIVAEITGTQNIDLDVKYNNASKPWVISTNTHSVTIDLTQKFTGSATGAKLYLGENEFKTVDIANGIVTIPAADFGLTNYGEKKFSITFSADSKDYKLTGDLLIITKYISNQSDLRSIGYIADECNGGGYYMVKNDFKVTWGFATSSDNYVIAKDSSKPFIGTIDGNGYSIDNLHFDGRYGQALIVYMAHPGTVKNISFTNITTGCSGSIIAHSGCGTFENINIVLGAGGYGGSSADGSYNANFFWGTVGAFFSADFGKAITPSNFSNIRIDVTAFMTTLTSSYKYQEYAAFVGAVAKDATLVNNVMVVGCTAADYNGTNGYHNFTKYNNVNYDEKTVGVYVEFADGTTNGVTFPATNWDTTYWTVDSVNNTVTWKTKA